jgi:NADH dehydrogenase/NADH:ubiquinone oxidoreductase 75 kD subunit (chain G)
MSIVYISLLILSLLAASQYFYDKIRAKNKIVHLDESKCVHCRRCVGKCRQQVLGAVNDGGKISVVVEQPHLCSACGNCVTACKYNALSIVSRKQPTLQNG